MLRLTAAALLFMASLAGCSSGSDVQGDADQPQLTATATTGVIRGVVVDEAIRPLAGVAIEIAQAGSSARTAATDANGFFGFDELAPGGYFVTAKKAGYLTMQQSVEVVAGVDEPPIVKIQLGLQLGELAFYTAIKIEGFMECAVTGANLCFILNYYPCFALQSAGQACTGNLTNDNSFFVLDSHFNGYNRVPDWTQAEMTWESTQSVFTYLTLRIDIMSEAPFIDFSNSTASGPTPLMASFNQSIAEEYELGVGAAFALEAFSGGSPVLCEIDDLLCIAEATVEQRITYFVHTFYGYLPPPDWRFTTDGTVPAQP